MPKRIIQQGEELEIKPSKKIQPITVSEKDKNTITKLVSERKRNVINVLRAWVKENPEEIRKNLRKSRTR